jgi:hypothetical protein
VTGNDLRETDDDFLECNSRVVRVPLDLHPQENGEAKADLVAA